MDAVAIAMMMEILAGAIAYALGEDIGIITLCFALYGVPVLAFAAGVGLGSRDKDE